MGGERYVEVSAGEGGTVDRGEAETWGRVGPVGGWGLDCFFI